MTLDRNWRFTYVNAAAERIFDRSRDELSATGSGTLPGARARPSSSARARVGRQVSFEQYYPPLGVVRRAATPSRGRPERLLPRHHRRAEQVARAEREREEATGRLQILSAPAPGLPARSRPASSSRSCPTSCSTASARASRSPCATRSSTPRAGDAAPAAPGRAVWAPRAFGHSLPRGCSRRRAGAAARAGGRRLAGGCWARSSCSMARGPARADRARRARRRRARQRDALGVERRLALTLQRSLLPTELPRCPASTSPPLPPGRRRATSAATSTSPPARGRPAAARDRRRHGPRHAGRRADGPAARGARRLRLRRRPARPRLAHLSVRAPALLDLPMATVLAAVYDPRDRG